MASVNDKAVIRRFQFSTSVAYAIEIGPGYMRFFREGAHVVTGVDNDIYQIATPYQEDHLHEIHFQQINDVVYLTHYLYPVYRLSRFADDDWQLEPVRFLVPPMLEENLTDITIACSATSGNGITLTADDAIFDPAHIGSFWRIGHKRDANSVNITINGNVTGSSLSIFGEWNVRTYGVWSADIAVQRSLDGGTTWETVRKFEGRSDRNVDATGRATIEAPYRLVVTNFTSATDARVIIESTDAILYGLVEIVDVDPLDDGEIATANVITPVYSTAATKMWQEGAWSAFRGYPRACAVHEQRLVFGGTDYQPSTVWGSVVGDFENFVRGSNDDQSFAFTLAGLELNAIQWLVSYTDLIIGTSGGVWRMRGNDLGDPITPTKVDVKQQSSVGSEYIQAIQAGSAVVFVEAGGRRIRELIYTDQERRYNAVDLTLLSEHLFRSRIVEMSWQQDEKILWVINNDGELLSLTYDREQAVVGWARHLTQGTFESVCTIYSTEFDTNEVWVVVLRTVNSIQIRYIERMGNLLFVDRASGFFVDSGLSYEGPPVTGFSGLDHLAGATVDLLADGRVYKDRPVNGSGEVFLPDGEPGASIVHAGLSYTSELSPFRLDADSGAGVHIGKVKRIDGLEARVLNSYGMEYEVEGNWYTIDPLDGAVDVPENEYLFGKEIPEDIPLDFHGNHTRDPRVRIIQRNPLPFTLLALAINYNVSSG